MKSRLQTVKVKECQQTDKHQPLYQHDDAKHSLYASGLGSIQYSTDSRSVDNLNVDVAVALAASHCRGGHRHGGRATVSRWS